MTEDVTKPAEIDQIRRLALFAFAGFCGWLAYLSLSIDTRAAEDVGVWALIIMFALLVVPARRPREESFITLVETIMGARRGRGN